MPLIAQDTAALSDAAGRRFGDFTITRIDGDVLVGRFTPGPDFPLIAATVRGFEEAANDLIFSVLDEFRTALDAYDLRLIRADGSAVAIHDLQINGAGGMSCRLRTGEVGERNGQSPGP